MYEAVLFLHSWLRWAVIIAGVLATVMAVANRPQVERWGLIFMITLDLQLLLGLLMYLGLSPNMSAIFANFGEAMGTSSTRFWAVEHVSLMLFAVIIAHVGRVLARKAPTPAKRRTRLMVCFGLALIAVLAATPWPGMAVGRPLFRF
jgi:hypothetical protein